MPEVIFGQEKDDDASRCSLCREEEFVSGQSENVLQKIKRDTLLRLIACGGVAGIGFWYPLWCEFKLKDPDSRLGGVVCIAFPSFVLSLLAFGIGY